ncbi:MAG: peptidyl-prolyl cis-trans isomerase [Alcanivoracaceae bacterium]|nr:peptidyl-prolyl cis-trans isomerase [Alcanivoracaceae bacterium]
MKVTVSDLDGFAYKIPDDKRIGFFDSPERIEKTLFSILNMKHIVKYGNEHDLVDNNKIYINVSLRIQDLFPFTENSFNLLKEDKVVLVREFLKKEEAYIQIQKNITESVNEKDLMELAHEKYMINKSNFIKKETRDLEFISVIYNKNNKKVQYLQAKKILDLINSKENTFEELQNKYKNNNADIEVSTLNGFKFDKVNVKFSDAIFDIEKIGVKENLIDYNMRFIITKTNKIIPDRQVTFEEIKERFLVDLKQKDAERKFNTLLISLTQDKLIVNEEALALLRERYR